MADNAFWIAALTAGTAVLASWVTSTGTARAARIQADTTASAQRVERLRQARRTAYAEFMEQAQRLSDVHWKVSDVVRGAGSGGFGPEQVEELRRLRERQRDEYATLRNLTWVVSLEGPDEVAELANKVRRTTNPFHKAIEAMIEGDTGAVARFDACYSPFWDALKDFIKASRDTLHAM
ncbi:hypothetical protein ACSCB1_24335 [Streptomyces europaeiscabiei]|uniref:Secreted protein n=1 Tax=Streptomyces europaeiscabiei TaxID=146819 RepID=A0ABU4NB21_9ACTN|nr:hypothetical protein [Streptomyces europaeiscabiei]MDX2524116.1 hypothetical protein [Streptomyces europaeiscabiei]MDX2763320.1 hypothetical protein [Streptomyces europaeiscabiei]MDX2770345.1 hypothetical protein [Streptomyces europaeiscabiei]MDX3545381.1 hypothetical protein [Streptomyces europaeiscabiei]MDX3554372.1 hypothetical protein [Streptomyces europaeiscabiei]